MDTTPSGISGITAKDICGPTPLIEIQNEPPARLIVIRRCPSNWPKAVVYIQYRTENLRIAPVFGKGALSVSPCAGHLHITVDDAPWHFVDASGETLIVVGLEPGPHKIRIELADPTHRVITSETVSFTLAKQSRSDAGRPARQARNDPRGQSLEMSSESERDPMNSYKTVLMTRRGFCLCCVGGAAFAATAGWLTPREAFAEARGIVSLIKDSAAVSPIVTHKLRNNVSVLEGSGGNIAVLTGTGRQGPDRCRHRRIARPAHQGARRSRCRSRHAPDQHALALRPY